MIRKTLALLAMFMVGLNVWAINPDWYKYSIYSYNVDDVIETGTKVYYLSDGNLFSFSPSDNESYAYNHLNMLSDIGISSIHYNYDKKYLVVVYQNSNIDVITDDGNVYNLPDIINSSVSYSRTVNDVAFGYDMMAIATNFGFVIYKDDSFEVKESAIVGFPIYNIGFMNNKLLVYGRNYTEWKIFYSPLELRHNNLEKFTSLNSYALSSIVGVSDNRLLVRNYPDNKFMMFDIDWSNNKMTVVPMDKDYVWDSPIRKFKDGYYTANGDNLLFFTAEGLTAIPLSGKLANAPLSMCSDSKIVWVGTPEGISRYDISSSTPTALCENILYNGSTTDKCVGYMQWSPDNKRLYISNREASVYHKYTAGEKSTNFQTTNIIDHLDVKDVSLMEVTGDHRYTERNQTKFNNKRMYASPSWILEDPDDPDKYYCGNYFEGVYVAKRNPQTDMYEQQWLFNTENATFTDLDGERVMYLGLDPEGNLWVGHQAGSKFSILPADKRRQDPSTLKQSDWIAHTKLEVLDYAQKDFTAVICKKSNMIFFSMAVYNQGFVALDTRGTYDDPSDDIVYHHIRLVDQDGNALLYNYITFFVEDNRGCVWVGTNTGVFEITDPSRAVDGNMTVRRIKVPRNDGTNFADYLLDSDKINWIAIDPADRKWIATDDSGIFLVSETGDKILCNYNTENSPLHTNLISTIECDKTDNMVYVGTALGLYSFRSDAAPAQENYDEILAYPNPVRPEYSGSVTITGLKENSIVKITDTVGKVVSESRSEGGMATWDVCNRNGDRVKSGVYYVYATSSDGSSSAGAVTKILVIN